MSTSTNTGTDMVSAYLDDELEPADAKAFEDLLESSPEVAEELAELQRVISLVGGLGDVQAPEDFYEKLNRRLRRRHVLQPPTTSWLSLVAVPLQLLSILVILAVAALYMMSELDAAPASIEREVLIPTGTTDTTVAPSPVRP